MVLVYLSAPIIKTGLQKDEFCNTIVSVIEDLGINIFAPQFLGPAESVEIYKRDVRNVRMCDFVIAEVSNPSLGVGMEIMLAIELQKPILMFHEADMGPISKMILGADGKVLLEYGRLEDVEKILRSHHLENLMVQKCPACNSHVVEVDGEDLRCFGCGFGVHQATV